MQAASRPRQFVRQHLVRYTRTRRHPAGLLHRPRARRGAAEQGRRRACGRKPSRSTAPAAQVRGASTEPAACVFGAGGWRSASSGHSIEGGHVVGDRVQKNDERARREDADTGRRIKQRPPWLCCAVQGKSVDRGGTRVQNIDQAFRPSKRQASIKIFTFSCHVHITIHIDMK
jgi:hypothetical protein